MTPSLLTPTRTETTAVKETSDRTGGLADAFMELLSYVQVFRQTAAQRQPAYDGVRGEILRLLKQSESFPAKNGCSWDAYDSARYAVCGWIDERVMASGWTESSRWRAELLQYVYYRTTDAGEKFFDRLKAMGALQNPVREVYYLCLALGFEGRYVGADGSTTLHQLKTEQLRLLFDGASETPTMVRLENDRLFPDALSKEGTAAIKQPSTVNQTLLTRLILGGSIVLLIVLYLVYRLSLHSLGTNILRAVGSR